MMGLAEQYKNSLSHKFGSDVAVFDYAADFDEFWCEKNQLPASHVAKEAANSKYKALIIVWDGMPDHGTPNSKLLAPHLTPLDWVLAFTIEMLSLGNEESVNFSIHIIDLTVKTYEDAHASRVRGTLLDEMPWVNLYAPLVPPNARYRKRYIPLAKLTGDDAIKELDLAVTMANSLHGRGDEAFEVLKNVANLWRSSVTQSDDHHDLNNIAAPILMPIMMGLKEITSGRLKGIETAFLFRLLWCDLIDSKTVKLPDQKFSSPLDIVAIDDQLASGWDKILGVLVGIPTDEVKAMPVLDREIKVLKILGSSSSVNLSGVTDPNCLLKALGITQDADTVKVDINLYKKRTFDSPVSNDSNSRPWMLVLDLRLFSGKVSEERKWYRTLANAAIQIAEWEKKEKEPVGKDVLAWSGFNENEQIQHLANEGALDDAHIDTALSLFARLCALRWPSVPIIMFSATGRRGLIAKLAEYGNIFLSSQKPNVLAGNQGEQVAAFTESWTRELQAALSLVDVQSSLLKLMQANNSARNKGHMQPNTHKHIVMALDETGDFLTYDQSAIGGVMLVTEGDSRNGAINKAFNFQEALRKAGINYYDQPPYYTDAGKQGASLTNPIEKKSDVSNPLAKIINEKNEGVTLGAFRYVIPKGKYSVNAYQDEAYLRGLTRCIELVTCEMLPSLGVNWGKNVTLSVWFASKQTGFEDSNGGADTVTASQAAMAYDFRFERAGGNLVETLGGFGKAYSIFLTAIGGRRELKDVMNSVVSLKTRKIPYWRTERGTPSPANDWYCKECNMVARDRSGVCRNHTPGVRTIADYSVMSHLADAVLHVIRAPTNTKSNYKDSLEASFSFDVREAPKLNDFLHATRLFDQERGKDGFKLAYTHGNFLDGINEIESGAKSPIASRLIQKLKEYAPSLEGTTLTELAGIRTRGIEASRGLPTSMQKRDKHNPKKAGAKPEGSKKVTQNSQSATSHHQVSANQQQKQGAEKNWIIFLNQPPVPPSQEGINGLAQIVFKKYDLVAIPNQQFARTTGKNLKVLFELDELKKLPSDVLSRMKSLIDQNKLNTDQSVKALLMSQDIQDVKSSQIDKPNVATAAEPSHIGKNIKKMGGKIELVWVQTVEDGGFWITFNKSNIGKPNIMGTLPSGWCPLDGITVSPNVGDEINVVFDTDLGYKNGFCLVRRV